MDIRITHPRRHAYGSEQNGEDARGEGNRDAFCHVCTQERRERLKASKKMRSVSQDGEDMQRTV